MVKIKTVIKWFNAEGDIIYISDKEIGKKIAIPKGAVTIEIAETMFIESEEE